MRELFRLKIASKRQMTAPQRLLDALHLSEGDEIQVEVADGQIAAVHACKAVPTAMLSADLLAEIKKQEHRLAQGKGLSLEEAMRQVEARKAPPQAAAGKGFGLSAAEAVSSVSKERQRQIIAKAPRKSELAKRGRQTDAHKGRSVRFGTRMIDKLSG